jgi:hypothetical protein
MKYQKNTKYEKNIKKIKYIYIYILFALNFYEGFLKNNEAC